MQSQRQQLQGPLLDAVFPLSEQYQRRFPNVMLGDNYSVQGFLSDATLEQSQQLQKILPDTRCVGSHPAQGLPLAQRSQPQEMITSDILPLTQQAWGPLSAVAYKDTQRVHTHRLHQHRELSHVLQANQLKYL